MMDKLNPQMGEMMGIVNQLKSSPNPMDTMQMMANTNPTLKQAMQMVGNGDPKTIAMNFCKQNGFDPSGILNMFGK